MNSINSNRAQAMATLVMILLCNIFTASYSSQINLPRTMDMRQLYTNSTAHSHHPPPPPPHNNKKKKYSNAGYDRTYNDSTIGASSTSSSQSQQQSSSGLVYTGFAAVAVVGLAALYHKKRDVVMVTHPLQGSIAKRMKRFDKLAGQASPQARGQDYELDQDNDEISVNSNSDYINMEMADVTTASDSPGDNAMAMV